MCTWDAPMVISQAIHTSLPREDHPYPLEVWRKIKPFPYSGVPQALVTVTYLQEHTSPLVTQAVAFPQAPVPAAMVAPVLTAGTVGTAPQSRASSATKLTQQGPAS